MKNKEEFELFLKQESISFQPVGGDLKKIGVDPREKIILFPEKDQQPSETISYFVFEKGDQISRETIERWCNENGWRLATGFELASLRKQLWEEMEEKLENEHTEDYSNLMTLTATVALGDVYKGNHVAATKANWDWLLTLYAPDECINEHFKFAITKKTA